MAWSVKYRSEFWDKHLLHWRLDFLTEDFTPTSEDDYTTLLMAEDAISYDFDNESDDVFDPIRISSISAKIVTPSFQLDDFYNCEDRSIKANLYAIDDDASSDGTDHLFWTGWVDTKDYKEAYEPGNHETTITCVDGLSQLNEIEYKNGDDYYIGRRRATQVLFDILSRIGYSEFIEYVNFYEVDMLNSVDDSPLEQEYLDTYTFRDKTCWEVLEMVLNKFNSFIRQDSGIFNIVRPRELVNSVVYGRHFTGTTVKTSVSYSTKQYIYRREHLGSIGSSLRQIPGGVRLKRRPSSKIIIEHDYGYKKSWIENWEFKGNTYNDVTGFWNNWTSAAPMSPLHDYLPAEEDGCMLPASLSLYSYPLYQQFATYAVQSPDDVLGLSFDYLHFNFSTSAISIILMIKVKADNGNYWLYDIDEGHCGWSNTLHVVAVAEGVPVGSTGWQSYSKIINGGLPVGGTYTITLYGSYVSAGTNGLVTGFKNVRFFCTSDSLTMKRYPKINFPFVLFSKRGFNPRFTKYVDVEEAVKEEYVSENSGVNGPEKRYQYSLGDVVDANMDNMLEQYAGSIAINVGTPTVRVDTITLSGNTGIVQITVNNVFDFAEFDTDPATTAQNFIDNFASKWLPIILTRSGNSIVFTGPWAGYDFSGESSCVQCVADLTGSVVQGSAYNYVMQPSQSWCKQGESNADRLLQLIADEKAVMYNRPRQWIPYVIQEMSKHLSLNLIGNIQDVLNTYGGWVCVFVINRGSFKLRERRWDIDLFEIGLGEVSPFLDSSGEAEAITVDNTNVYVDATNITVDNG